MFLGMCTGSEPGSQGVKDFGIPLLILLRVHEDIPECDICRIEAQTVGRCWPGFEGFVLPQVNSWSNLVFT